MRILLTCLLAILALPSAVKGAPGKTEARLLLAADTARPGTTVLAGVQLRMPPRWHTYWRNSGDSGAATRIDWTLPPGVVAGEIQWPLPAKLSEAGLTTYVYYDDVVLLVPLTLAADLSPGTLDLRAKVSWLECEKVCLPGSATLAAKLAIGAAEQASDAEPLLRRWQQRLPRASRDREARASWAGPADEETRTLQIDWQPPEPVRDPDFLPYASPDYEIAPATEIVAGNPGSVQLRKRVQRYDGSFPGELSGVLVGKLEGAGSVGVEIQIPIAASQAARASAGGSESSKTGDRPGSKPSPWAMLLFAFLGGLILNVMPCVLPVIALKVLSFVQHSREAPGEVRRLGLIYGLGVLVSFLALAGIVIVLQQAGRSTNWGMQFQNAQFLIGMTVLVTLVALNLFGVFEVSFGGAAIGAASGLAARPGAAGAFFHGVLATALATPCTAPFLAIALGFAFSQSASVIVMMFLMIGLGLAFPYVLLSFVPGLARWLPKPGAWMQRFKVAMGFPMLATAVWLLALVARHYGNRGLLWVGLFLTALALAAWVWGEFVQRSPRHPGWARGLSLLLVLFGYFYALERELDWRSPPETVAGSGHNLPGGIPWEPWSPEAVAKARAEGRPVLVDFTADWCVTCQANKKTSLEIPSVRQKLKDLNAVALLGDYTTEDESITQELKKFGRAGVPLVLVYPANPKAEPYILPEVLTPGIVLEHLDQAAP